MVRLLGDGGVVVTSGVLNRSCLSERARAADGVGADARYPAWPAREDSDAFATATSKRSPGLPSRISNTAARDVRGVFGAPAGLTVGTNIAKARRREAAKVGTIRRYERRRKSRRHGGTTTRRQEVSGWTLAAGRWTPDPGPYSRLPPNSRAKTIRPSKMVTATCESSSLAPGSKSRW